MTFKHINFKESPTMRSLERLAQEKGLIKNDPLEKFANAKPKKAPVDLTPTKNLIENLLKLCSGLRESKLDKHAEELESTFLMYKKAESLYETSKETGEDLVHSAHPNGSHKLEGVDGDAIIETIIDQHLKDIKMVEKKPTGKLSNASEIINAVKVILAESQSIKNIMAGISNRVKQAMKLANSAGDLSSTIESKANDTVTNIVNITSTISADPESATSNQINNIISGISRLIKLYEPSSQLYKSPLEFVFPESLSQGIKNQNIWSSISGLLNGSMQLCKKAKSIIVEKAIKEQQKQSLETDKENTEEDVKADEESKIVYKTKPVVFTSDYQSLLDKINNLKSVVAAWKSASKVQNNREATNWIDSELATLSKIFNNYKDINEFKNWFNK